MKRRPEPVVVARAPPDPSAPLPFETRRVWPTPENVWSVGQFWKLAHTLADQHLTGLHARNDALTVAAKSGVIDPAIVADSVMGMALHDINMQIPPAGNA